MVYVELQRIARDQFSRESEGHTLQPTALVHEAFSRFLESRRVQWQNRDHFFGFAAHLMRRILVDHARKKKALKRGGDAQELSLSEVPALLELVDDDILRLHAVLEELEVFNPEGSEVVEMRFFGGLKYAEIAKLQGVSASTVRNRWQAAKLWLYRELRREGKGEV